MSIGNKIKLLRKYYGATQRELCENICTQGMISLIERNMIIPNSHIVRKIASKLSVSADYILDNTIDTVEVRQLEYLNQVKEEMASLFYSKEYKTIFSKIIEEKLENKFFTVKDKQLLDFYNNVFVAFVNKKWYDAYEGLNETLYLTYYKGKKNICYQELLIMINLVSILMELNELDEINRLFKKIFCILTKQKYCRSLYKDHYKISYIYTEIASGLSKQRRYKEVINVVSKGIEWSITPNVSSLFRLEYLYYLKGYSEKRIGDINFRESYSLALSLAKIKNNNELISEIINDDFTSV